MNLLESYLTPKAYQALQAEKAKRAVLRLTPRYYDGDDPAEFISREMVIPETGKPIELHPEQADVLRAMSHMTNGAFDFSTWLYSAPKKSGKTTIGAGVALWQACRVPDGQVYIIGNDQKQADNRMMQAIRYAIDHNPRLQKRARLVRFTVYLDNGTKIESIPVDPRGEAGMNPTGLFWTEAWGAIGNRPELLWTEAALSPTRVGQSFKFVESYAGYTGQSLILERLYNSIIRNGKPHDTIPELYIDGASIGYWCTRHIMEWQRDNPDYYAQEAKENAPSEYSRIHENQWASSQEAFVPIEWWDACKADLPPLEPKQSIILGLDAAVENDCFAIVGVTITTRDGVKVPQVRYVKVWTPPKNGQIDFSAVEAELTRLIDTYSVTCISYDPYQMADMAQRLGHRAFWFEFKQGAPRLMADKQLFDIIRDRRIEQNGDMVLRQHMLNADRKPDDDKLRIIKRAESQKIDACVALSMSVERALYYNLG